MVAHDCGRIVQRLDATTPEMQTRADFYDEEPEQSGEVDRAAKRKPGLSCKARPTCGARSPAR